MNRYPMLRIPEPEPMAGYSKDCRLCGEKIEDPKQAWRETRGWVDPRKGKGMTGATPTGYLAHPECIVRLRLKLSPQQETLLESEEALG